MLSNVATTNGNRARVQAAAQRRYVLTVLGLTCKARTFAFRLSPARSRLSSSCKFMVVSLQMFMTASSQLKWSEDTAKPEPPC